MSKQFMYCYFDDVKKKACSGIVFADNLEEVPEALNNHPRKEIHPGTLMVKQLPDNVYLRIRRDLNGRDIDELNAGEAFARKLVELLDNGTLTVINLIATEQEIKKATQANCVGREDEDYLYLFPETTYMQVIRNAEDLKGLASMRMTMSGMRKLGLLRTGSDARNTKIVRFGSRSVRCLWVKKAMLKRLIERE